MRCKNAMEGSKYLSKLAQPETIQKLVLKLPFSLRTRWRRLADHIMEVELRLVNFGDLADFVDNESRVATNLVFERIVDDAKPRATGTNHLRKRPGERKSPELSLATQIRSDQCPPTVAPCPVPSSPEDNSKCPFCKSGHALDNCDSLRSRPYPERIQFLMSKNLCFGCLSNNHTARNCPKRNNCSFPNCTKKHPTVLHTNSTARSRPAADSPTIPTLNEETTRVHNGMVSLDEDTRNTGGASFPEIGTAVVPVKVWTKDSETPTITYAFLDSGSSSTFCSETLMRQLGISGAETKISLTTLEKKDSIINSFILTGLTISDLDENVFIELPALYTRPRIPVYKDDIPKQVDLDRWP